MPAAPVAGLPPADRGDLHGVVSAAVTRLGQVRAAARELTAGLPVGAAAPLEHDVPSAVHDMPPGERYSALTRALAGRHQRKPVRASRGSGSGHPGRRHPEHLCGNLRDSASDARPVPGFAHSERSSFMREN